MIRAFISASAFLVSATSAFACSCIMPGDVTAETLEGTLVFRGTPISQTDSPSNAGTEPEIFTPFPERVTTFDLTHIYHADPALFPDEPPKTFAVTHGTSSASCGVNYRIGEPRFVIVSQWRGEWMAGLCVPFTEDAIVEDALKATPLARSLPVSGAATRPD